MSRLDPPHTGRPAADLSAVRPTPPAPPPGLSATPDLGALLGALRRRWIAAVLLSATLGTGAAAAAYYALSPEHTAFAKLKVSAEIPDILGNKFPGGSGDFRTYLQTTAAQIASRPVILSALKRDEVKRLNLEAREADPVQYIEEKLKIESKEGNELLTILMSSNDPQVAIAVANAIKESYLDNVVYAERNARVRKVTELEKAYGESVDALKTKRENLKKIGDSLGATDPGLWREQRNEAVTALRDSRQQQIQVGFKLVEARSALEVFDARVKAMKDPTGAGMPVLADLLDTDQEYRQLQSRAYKLEELIADFAQKGAGDYATPREARRRLAGILSRMEARKKVVAARLKRIGPGGTPTGEDPAVYRAQMQRTVDSLTKLDEKLRTEIKDLSTIVNKVPVRAAEYENIAEEIKRDEDVLKELGGKLERERVELRAAPRITTFQDGELMKKETKKQLLATAAAPLAILFVVCTGLAYAEFRQRRIRNAGQVSRGLGIRVVGAVPAVPNLERHLASVGESDLEGHPVMESIDAIRTQLLHDAGARSTRVVMVTSATHGEGKTTLAGHLAGSLARAGRKTLLIDGDLRRPTVHELFEVPMQPGFSEVLLAEIEVADAIQETGTENLSVMPAGQWDREVLLALARDGMQGVFEKLQEEFDFVIVDSHPVLPATDSLLIGRQADAVILSVLRDVSQMPRVYGAAQQLGALGIRVLGAVVNGTNPEEVFTAPPAAVVAV
jgi:capsular exopolysaccharide synthesis family protein